MERAEKIQTMPLSLTDTQLAKMSHTRPLGERLAIVQCEADKLGPVDPDFDQKEFSDVL